MGNGGGLGGFMTDLMGGGNDYHQDVPTINKSDYGYGGRVAGDFDRDAGMMGGRKGAQIDYTNANQTRGLGMQSRDQSSQALDLARQAAMGQAPSVAQQQLLQGRDMSIQNAMAMANSVRGGGANLAAAQMGAQRQAGEAMGQVNQQSAMLRANEMAQARAQYGGMAAQQRAQDLQAQGLDANQAQAQAQLEQQQHALNDQYSLGLYGLGQHAADSAQMGGIKSNEDTASSQLGAGQINAGVAAGNAGQNAAGGNQALGTAAGLAGAAMMFSDERLKSGVHPIGTSMGSNSLEDRRKQIESLNARMGGSGNDPYARGVQMGTQFGGALASAFGGGGGGAAPAAGAADASLMSDARLKSGVMGGGNQVDHFLGSLNPVAYHYKPGVPGEDPHAARYGILAQDVATTPMGRSLVEHTPIGMGINVPHATGALMAGEGELYARQRRLEAELARVHGGR